MRTTSQGQHWDSTTSKHKLHPGKDEEGKWEKRGSKSPPPHMCVTNENNATQTLPSDHHPLEGKTAKAVREKNFLLWKWVRQSWPQISHQHQGPNRSEWRSGLQQSEDNDFTNLTQTIQWENKTKKLEVCKFTTFSQAFVFLERSCDVILADCTCYVA